MGGLVVGVKAVTVFALGSYNGLAEREFRKGSLSPSLRENWGLCKGKVLIVKPGEAKHLRKHIIISKVVFPWPPRLPGSAWQ